MIAKSKKPNRILDSDRAFEIYQYKAALRNKSDSFLRSANPSQKGQSVFASSLFDVSPKTIRDIWNRRTWQHVTYELWEQEDLCSEYSGKVVVNRAAKTGQVCNVGFTDH
jgi:hypothetical protein